MTRVDIEYAHAYVSAKEGPDVADMRRSAEFAAGVAEWYRSHGAEVTLSVLVDDYSAPGGNRAEALAAAQALDLVPDVVFEEGSFAEAAERMVSRLRSKFVKGRVTGRTFLAEGRDLADVVSEARGVTMFDVLKERADIAPARFRFALNFDIDFVGPEGEKRLSCPVLAAAWHAYRLGLETGPVTPEWGRVEYPVDFAVSVLPGDYLQVEASAQALLRALGPEGRAATARCRTVFY
jgi:hypothetical protein